MALAVDATGTKLIGGSSVTTINYTGITVGSGSQRALLVTLVLGASATTSAWSATWDNGGTNQAMTVIKSLVTSTSGIATAVIFGLLNPTAGNKTLALSWTGSQFPVVCAQSYTGADQTSVTTTFKNANSSATSSLTITSATGDIAVAVIAAAGSLTSLNQTSIYLDTTSSGADSAASRAVGAASVTFTATGASGSIAFVGCDIAAASAAVVATIVEQNLFDPIVKLKLVSDLSQLPFATVAAQTPTIFVASSLFDPIPRAKQPDRLQEDFGAPFLTPTPPLTSLFDVIKSRPQTIDNSPILFAPAAVARTFIVEQSLFDTIVPKRPTEFTQGPFGGTSPAISVAYFTQSLFDPTKLKQPSISVPDVTPQEPFKFFGERWFEVTQIKRTLVETPPILLATKAVATNIVEQPFFDALPRIKLPERLGEFYPQRFWVPQLYQSLFDSSIKLKVLASGDWTPTGAVQINTLRYAISDWFVIVRPKQPLVETPLVDYFPFVAPATPAQYVLLVPHYINDGYYPAYTTVTEGVELPFGWPPTLAVEPLNAPAIQNYWNQGPKPMTDAQPYKEFFPFFQTYKRSVYWLPTGIPGQFQLTGNGAALGPRT